jgi:DNA-binding NarL/FixJ family response regulator
MARVTQSGSQFLQRKSELAKARHGRLAFKDVLIVEDVPLDAERLRATLRTMLGYDIEYRRATTLGSALDAVIERAPDIIFLDDHLPPTDTATETIPFLRRCNYTGPIVIVSGLLSPRRAAELTRAGAIVAMHKDKVDSSAIEEALAKVYAALDASGTKPTGADGAGAPAAKKR